jgi:hypothetical protein
VLAAVLVAFTLFGSLETIRYERDAPPADDDVIVVQNAGMGALPDHYASRIAGLKDVQAVTGVLGTPVHSPARASQLMVVFGVNAGALATFPGLGLSPKLSAQWTQTRIGAICDERTVREMGWHVGQRISPRMMSPGAGGNDQLEMVLLATYSSKTVLTGLITHYEYLRELMPGLSDFGTLFVRARSGASLHGVAREIDALFRSGPVETQSAPVLDFRERSLRNAAAIRMVIRGTIAVAFFTLVLVVANALSQSVRDRIGELALMQAFGFQRRTIFFLTFSEGLILFAIGAALGLLLATVGFASNLVTAPSGTSLLPPHTVVVASLCVLACALIAFVPACWELSRLRVADALRRL